MSYILDALRRAQAERERGEVPGLDAQPAPPPVSAGGGSMPNRWLATGLVLLFLGGLALVFAAWWSRPGERAVPPPAAAPPLAGTATATPIVTPAEVPVGAGSAGGVAQAPAPALPVVVSAAPGATAGAVPEAGAGPGPGAIAPASAAAARAGSAPPAGPAAGPAALPLEQIPAARRRELPPLAVGGSVWSENAATRFVIIDGQLLREGDRLNAQLVLERIAPRAAVLRWREEQRIELRW